MTTRRSSLVMMSLGASAPAVGRMEAVLAGTLNRPASSVKGRTLSRTEPADVTATRLSRQPPSLHHRMLTLVSRPDSVFWCQSGWL